MVKLTIKVDPARAEQIRQNAERTGRLLTDAELEYLIAYRALQTRDVLTSTYKKPTPTEQALLKLLRESKLSPQMESEVREWGERYDGGANG